MSLLDIPQIDERQPWPTIVISTSERETIARPAPLQVKVTHPPRRNTAPGNLTSPPGIQVASVAPLPLPTPPRARGGAVWGWLGAFPKGALIGTTLFALFYGFFSNREFWLIDWHWAYLAGGMILATILVRFDRMLLLVAAVGLWYSRAVLLDMPELFAVWIAGGIIGRLLYEMLP